jgi:hypothetical protein
MSETGTQHGYLVIADISGYTSYVAKTELEHSQEILAELLEVIVAQLTTLLTLSKLEGDAVFGYVSELRVPRSETILELVESTYVAFKDKVLNMNRRTTCTCNACLNIPMLDLKFIVHHGDYIRQQIMDMHELVGSAVNLAHRLLKNSVAEATGWHAYALFTEAALAHMGIALDADGAHASVEHYEHLGDVPARSFNLQERYKALSAARRVVLLEKDADVIFHIRVDAPPPVVWTWLNDSGKRNLCAVTTLQWRAGERAKGRTGVGARNHCAHGGGESTETIVDWRPFDYYSTESTMPQMKGLMMHETSRLEPLDDGRATLFHYNFRMDFQGMPRFLSRLMCRVIMRTQKVRQNFDNMARLAAQDAAGQSQEDVHAEPHGDANVQPSAA